MAYSDYLGLMLQVGSTILDTQGALARGDAAALIGQRRKAAAEFEADQLDIEAAQSRSAGMHLAQEEARKTLLINSAALARAAASGAGASDPTVIHLLTQNAGVGAHRAAMAMYQGEAQARVDRARAIASRFEGETAELDAGAAQKAARYTATSTLMSGGLKTLSMYEKYYAGPQVQDTA
jgi:hypothetical protein